MPGPAPDPNARRRNKRQAAMVLPSGGRGGRAPSFPIKGQRVPAVWAELWKTPQSAAWERLGYHRTVARYALLLGHAESPDATAALLNEVRQLEDRLGLTPMSMKRLEWVISDDEVSERRSEKKPPTERRAGRTPEERRRIMQAVV